MPESRSNNLPSPFDVFTSPTPQIHPRFPRQQAMTGGAYRAQCSDRMRAWVLYVIEADQLIQPEADDSESIQRIKRMAAWRVLLRQSEIEAGHVTNDERSLMEAMGRAIYDKLERECVDDVADRLADSAEHGYMVGPFVKKLGA